MKKILLLLSLSVFAVSCNNEFTSTAAPSADAVKLTVTPTQTGACSYDFAVKGNVAGTAKVYYALLSVSDTVAVPVSSELWRGEYESIYIDSTAEEPVRKPIVVKNVALPTSGMISISETGLTPGLTYAFYSISVNADGIRTEEVFSQTFTVPAYNAQSLAADFTDATFKGAPTVNNNSEFSVFTPIVTKVSDFQYSFDTFWGPIFVSEALNNPTYANNASLFYGGTMTINPNTFVVTIVGNNTASWDNLGGTGTYDPCSKTVTYTLNHTLFRLNSSGVLVAGAPSPTTGTSAPVTVVMTL